MNRMILASLNPDETEALALSICTVNSGFVLDVLVFVNFAQEVVFHKSKLINWCFKFVLSKFLSMIFINISMVLVTPKTIWDKPKSIQTNFLVLLRLLQCVRLVYSIERPAQPWLWLVILQSKSLMSCRPARVIKSSHVLTETYASRTFDSTSPHIYSCSSSACSLPSWKVRQVASGVSSSNNFA